MGMSALLFGLFVKFRGGNIEDAGPVTYLALKEMSVVSS